MQNPGEINSGLGGNGENVQGAPPQGIAAQGLANYVDVRSYVFEVKVDADINGYKRTFYGIVSRGAQAVASSSECVKFYWE